MKSAFLLLLILSCLPAWGFIKDKDLSRRKMNAEKTLPALDSPIRLISVEQRSPAQEKTKNIIIESSGSWGVIKKAERK